MIEGKMDQASKMDQAFTPADLAMALSRIDDRHNFKAAVIDALEEQAPLHTIRPGEVLVTAIYHDTDCPLQDGGFCTCAPDVKITRVGQKAADA